MIVLINVTVGNCLDDSTRNVILSCDSLDVDVLNNLGVMADIFVKLCEWSQERIVSVEKIKPINISSDKECYGIVEGVFS
ncbi:MAG: hypothetical protein HRU18_03825 [Pseudoalteromonas sp.]|uniref:hypothetical protein n=1 Tax=Pseudoalteromonas sp. TaxID=53249 RepID=UPI001D99FFBD|nr:hypothetical protein [Pseudoalteromonas sp.]NRA77316.1 hypothetical protein [Pseudoalteromonas sp.]